MDKNQNFFDPYNFTMQQHIPHNTNMPPQDMNPAIDNPINPAMYYVLQIFNSVT
mgnify:CR=1 FL=1